MLNSPRFTVLIPAKGRPELARDALLSVLHQSFEQFEVIFSNNGADPLTRRSVEDLISDPRVRYIDQSNILSMPEHWDRLAGLARGTYLLVLTDRSVLKQGALAELDYLHRHTSYGDIISWPWDLYYRSGHCISPSSSGRGVEMPSAELVRQASQPNMDYPMILPRGLNSSVSVELIDRIREKTGRAFGPICPDFSFAFDCIFSNPGMFYFDKPLMISQGLDSSNGGNAYASDAGAYIATLGLEQPFVFSPIKLPLVENAIVEDFLAAAHRHGHTDAAKDYDMSTLYFKCFAELEVKRGFSALTKLRIETYEAEILETLNRESIAVQEKVLARHRSRQGLRTKVRNTIKRLVPRQLDTIRQIKFQLTGAKRYTSALQAAGHCVK